MNLAPPVFRRSGTGYAGMSPAAPAAAKPKKPTQAQLRVLRNLAAGRRSDWHCRTRSDYGGLSGTVSALQRNGWMVDDELTDAGRAAACT